MFQSSLQTPKTGKSRFSKALPPAPLENTSSRTPTSPVKASPRLPWLRSKNLPAVPPKDDESASKSTKSELPPLPVMAPLAPIAPIGLPVSPRAPPPSAIPRRPVAKPQAPVVEAEPSPTHSLSSLLSAYSRSSGESLVRSSDAGTSTKEGSEPTLSPTREEMGGKRDEVTSSVSAGGLNKGGVADHGTGRIGLVADETGPIVRPTKPDTQRLGAPQTGGNGMDSRTEPIAQESSHSSSSQAWRRRSLRSDQHGGAAGASGGVADLQVQTTSQVSTSGSDSQNRLGPYSPSPYASNQNSPARPLQPPVSPNGLPGRDIRPAASRDRLQQQQQPEQPSPSTPQAPQAPLAPHEEGATMGTKVSRLKEKLLARTNSTASTTTKPQSQFPPRSTSRTPSTLRKTPNNRPPTPDYAKNEVVVPVLDTVVSPVSPASSPEPSRDEPTSDQHAAAPAAAPAPSPAAPQPPAQQTPVPQTHQEQQPQPQPQEAQRHPVARKAVPTKDLQPARSLPEIRSSSVAHTSGEQPPPLHAGAAEASNNDATSAPDDAPIREAQSEAAPSRDSQHVEQNYKFPPRTSSTRVPQRQPPPPLLSSPASMQEMRPGSRGQGPYQAYRPGQTNAEDAAHMVKSRPEPTVYREVNQDDLPPPDPRAAYFPLRNEQGEPINTPPPPTTVFRAPKLTAAHYECFVRHTQMVPSRNKVYSLTCQTCNIEDSEMRWQCAWCRLRVCARCVRTLQKVDKDLARLLDYVEKNPPGSGMSSRPSTSSGALGRVEETPETERSAEELVATTAEPAKVHQ